MERSKQRLSIQTYKQEGDLDNTYSPLRNILNKSNQIVEFNTNELNIDLNNPLNIECQPSYDGTVNLIINDDKNPPRIINSRFTKLEDNKYKIINRNQLQQTNLYKEGKIDQQTRLFRNINKIPRIDLINVYNMGQLKGGNYTFYIKFADNDYNKTDIVAESGQISIFKGNLTKVESISGTIAEEITDKAITLKISNIDTSFSKFYVYFTRETCDENGIRLTKAGMFTQPYDIKTMSETIIINGYEEIEELSPEEINIQYNLVTAVKTQAQVQNMLFFGNVQGLNINIKDLQNISYFINVSLKSGSSIGWISPKDYKQREEDDISQSEYYNPTNIYYKLGYWPEEIYRLGIVYIMNDDSLSPVFNLRGCSFEDVNYSNFDSASESLYKDPTTGEMNYLERDDFLTGKKYLDNTFGVFKNPTYEVLNFNNETINPLYYQVTFSPQVKGALSKYSVKGYFIVRQKRIPTILCQGLSIGVDRSSYIPMLYNNSDKSYFTESFLSPSRTLVHTFNSHIKETKTTRKQCSGLLSVDVNLHPQLQSNFDGSEFILKQYYNTDGTLNTDGRHFFISYKNGSLNKNRFEQASATFVDSETPLKYVNGFGYSTKCGAAEDVSQFSFFDERNYNEKNTKLLRGLYCPFLGINTSLQDNTLYSVKIPNYSESSLKEYFLIRGKDNSPFFAVSDRYELSDLDSSSSIDVYRGDCYSATVTIRLNRNFVDSEVPINDTIIDPDTWKKNYKGYMNTINGKTEDSKKGSFTSINRADVNTVNLGMWVTYKCLSNYNLGLRCEDRSYTDEFALMGSPRSFYPITDMSTVVSHKIEESRLLNDGYSATVSHKRNYIVQNVPYVKELFDNRIMFSNVQREDNFQNAYRIFQGLSFEDIDRQYGAIVKFIPWGVNILCIFEHGIGVIPINEKALLQTTTGQSIHMYGAGVLQSQISLISPDFGSIWPESIIRTPKGVYGVDTYAKKIWRYSDNGGLENISDMKVQQFLNNNIKLSEKEKYPIIGLKNVKSHYNNYKGDVMFTFYNDSKNTTWNLCYNERMDRWITRYSWTPLYSENINNVFYSLDQSRTKILGYIYNNLHCTYGIRTSSINSKRPPNEWIIDSSSSNHSIKLTTVGYSLADSFSYKIDSIETSYVDNAGKEISIKITDTNQIDHLFHINTDIISMNYATINEWFLDSQYKTRAPIYFKLNITVTINIGDGTSYLKDSVGIIANNKLYSSGELTDAKIFYNNQRNAFLRNGFYVHGRAGIFDEIDYENSIFDDQILPTKWYEKQEPFEFEFVVNGDVGLHKIFDNLVIISNNVQPNEIEYEIIGDVYKFNKAGIYRNQKFGKDIWDRKHSKPSTVIPDNPNNSINSTDWPTSEFKGDLTKPRVNNSKQYKSTQDLLNCEVKWDTTLNSYSLVLKQPCKNFEEFGRRLGNIHYKEDAWYIAIDPIRFKERFKVNGSEESEFTGPIKSAKLRDKFIKIRVKYTGEDIVVITALKTLLTLSYA